MDGVEKTALSETVILWYDETDRSQNDGYDQSR